LLTLQRPDESSAVDTNINKPVHYLTTPSNAAAVARCRVQLSALSKLLTAAPGREAVAASENPLEAQLRRRLALWLLP